VTTPVPASSPALRARLAFVFLMPLLVGACLLVFNSKAHAMGKMHLFSAVQGVVVQKGAPVEDAVVEREYFWHWKDKREKLQVKTDATGGFKFPEATGSSFLGGLLPHEPVIQQTIRITHKGQTYTAWAFDKGDYEANTELEGKPISLVCDLDQAPSHKGPRDRVYGICQLR
jgi:hypothetical protein